MILKYTYIVLKYTYMYMYKKEREKETERERERQTERERERENTPARDAVINRVVQGTRVRGWRHCVAIQRESRTS